MTVAIAYLPGREHNLEDKPWGWNTYVNFYPGDTVRVINAKYDGKPSERWAWRVTYNALAHFKVGDTEDATSRKFTTPHVVVDTIWIEESGLQLVKRGPLGQVIDAAENQATQKALNSLTHA